jgi:hypothetical protein
VRTSPLPPIRMLFCVACSFTYTSRLVREDSKIASTLLVPRRHYPPRYTHRRNPRSLWSQESSLFDSGGRSKMFFASTSSTHSGCVSLSFRRPID